ncbi:MAG: M15 family metallopeptidase [Flavobacteriales bacterium]
MKKSFYFLLVVLFSCETNIENIEQSIAIGGAEDIETLPVKDSILKKKHDNLITADLSQGGEIRKKLEEDLRKDSSYLKRKKQDEFVKELNSIGLESYLRSFYLVDIQEVEPNIRVDLKYSTTDNFVGIDMYGDLDKAFAHIDLAHKLKKAYSYLQQEDSSLTLLVFDCVRPVFVQQKMWDTLVMPIREKTKFLSNPKNRSIHNYGAAVDISITSKNGKELDMGTPFDFIGKLAHPREERRLLKEGKLTQKQVKNRVLLRKVMKKAGFFNIQTEWWHWNSCSRNTAKRKYKLVG